MERSMFSGKGLQNVGRKPGNERLWTGDEDTDTTTEVQTYDTCG